MNSYANIINLAVSMRVYLGTKNAENFNVNYPIINDYLSTYLQNTNNIKLKH